MIEPEQHTRSPGCTFASSVRSIRCTCVSVTSGPRSVITVSRPFFRSMTLTVVRHAPGTAINAHLQHFSISRRKPVSLSSPMNAYSVACAPSWLSTRATLTPLPPKRTVGLWPG